MITIEQAVEAVRKHGCRDPVHNGPCEAIIAALRAIPPAEPTEEEVERVAMAILAEAHYEGSEQAAQMDLGEMPRMQYARWIRMARAAIAAMKQPGGKER